MSFFRMFSLLLLLATLFLQTFSQNSTAHLTSSSSLSTTTSATPTTTTLPPGQSIVEITIQVYTSTIGLPSQSSTASSHRLLDTKIDATFGILGAILIATGLPMSLLGGRNRWSSYFLTGFYFGALITLVFILRFGVEKEVNTPSESTRGLFLFACLAAGLVFGALSILFYKGTKLLIGLLGGFFLGMWILAMKDNVLIGQIGFRYLFLIGFAAVGFILNLVPVLLHPTTIVSTSVLGATSFILGVDCFTTASLKEFYVNILGFGSILPSQVQRSFPVSSSMYTELGVAAIITLMGIASQVKLWNFMQEKVLEIARNEKRKEDEEKRAGQRIRQEQAEHLVDWEEKHGGKRGSVATLEPARIKLDNEGRRRSSTFSLLGDRSHKDHQSSMSPTPGTTFSELLGSPAAPLQSTAISLKTPQRTLTNLERDPTNEVEPTLFANKSDLEEIAKLRESISTLKRELKISESTLVNINSENSSQTPARPHNGPRLSNAEFPSFSRRDSGVVSSGKLESQARRSVVATNDNKKWEDYLSERKMIYAQPQSIQAKANHRSSLGPVTTLNSSSSSKPPHRRHQSSSAILDTAIQANTAPRSARPDSTPIMDVADQPTPRLGRDRANTDVKLKDRNETSRKRTESQDIKDKVDPEVSKRRISNYKSENPTTKPSTKERKERSDSSPYRKEPVSSSSATQARGAQSSKPDEGKSWLSY